MTPRILDPIDEIQPKNHRLRSLLGIGIFAAAAYLGGTYLLNRQSDVSHNPGEQHIESAPAYIEQQDQDEVMPSESAGRTIDSDPYLTREQADAPQLESLIEDAQHQQAQSVESVDASERAQTAEQEFLPAYTQILVDSTMVFPAALDVNLEKLTDDFRQIGDETARARAIFDWEQANIRYGDDIRQGVGYRNSLETVRDRQGVCGEEAYLYIALARASNLEARYAVVKIDHAGKEVGHACAVVTIAGRQVMVDPAYHAFDINHQQIIVYTDQEMISDFDDMRKNNNGRCTNK